MSDHHKLLWKLTLFGLLLVGTLVAAYMELPPSQTAVMATVIDKERLLETAPGHRMILVGGSSVAFGVDSSRLQQAFSDRWFVVNTGLHGGLGLSFMLAMVTPFVRPGDTIVLAPEYSLLYDIHTDHTALNEALGEYPGAWRYAPWFTGELQPSVILLTVQKRVNRFLGLTSEPDDPVYRRTAFDAHGDMVGHLGRPGGRLANLDRLAYRDPAPQAMRLLNEFYTRTLAKGARIFLTFPPYPQVLRDPDVTASEWLQRIRSSTPIPVISNPDDYLFPLDSFFDTVYHLNERGREQRTRRLIHDLRKTLAESDPVAHASEAR